MKIDIDLDIESLQETATQAGQWFATDWWHFPLIYLPIGVLWSRYCYKENRERDTNDQGGSWSESRNGFGEDTTDYKTQSTLLAVAGPLVMPLVLVGYLIVGFFLPFVALVSIGEGKRKAAK